MSEKSDIAKKIQVYIDDEFGIDIAYYQRSELIRLSKKLQAFIETGVDTEDLEPAGDILYEEDH